jgi:carboxypeptidase C (cathepsin A)
VVCGYYDLVTPVGSTEYVIHHLGLKPELRGNISLNYYHSGHMIYISKVADARFKTDGEAFYKNALSPIKNIHYDQPTSSAD